METAVIVDAVRLASGRGKQGGALSSVHPVTMLARVLSELVRRNDLDPALVDDVLTGCVSQVGEQSGNIGRTAVLAAGFPETVPATTIDRQCGSSQQAAHFAAQGVMAGAYDVVIACGVESMSRVPMFSSLMGKDNLGPAVASRYPKGLVQQGISAELIATRWKLDRDTLDRFAARSHRLAAEAIATGAFAKDLVAMPVTAEDGSVRDHIVDETVRASTTAEKLAELNPSFWTPELSARFPDVEWKITPGNSSPLTDGASALLIMSERRANELGLSPRGRFHSFSVVGSDPLYMLTGPIPATEQALRRGGLTIDRMDAYEVNEAFASVPLAWAHEVGADPAKLNQYGGAIALGHPMGSSGTRLLGTLLNRLEATGGRYGLQAICEGGGMANATVIERLSTEGR